MILSVTFCLRQCGGDTTLRFAGGKIVKAAAKTDGIMPPPRKPCTPRHRIISLMDDEVAHRNEAAVNPAAEIANR